MHAAISGCLKFKFGLSESVNPRAAIQPSESLISAQLTFLLILQGKELWKENVANRSTNENSGRILLHQI